MVGFVSKVNALFLLLYGKPSPSYANYMGKTRLKIKETMGLKKPTQTLK